MSPNSTDCGASVTVESGRPTTSAVMFALGVAGNVAALALLETRRRRKRPSPYRVLVTALVATDLLGTVAVSPVVLDAYATNTTLVAMAGRNAVCAYFGFSMTFLSLSTLSILCAMALERFLSLGFPYFYDRHVTGTCCAYVTVALIYLVCVLYCAGPLAGFGGSYVQYCPGTWCFLDMSPSEPREAAYTGLYACFTLLVVACTSVCNVSAICFLVKMHRRQKTRRRRRSAAGGGGGARHARFFRRSQSMTEEVEHLLPLVFITAAFSICSFQFLLQVCINIMGGEKEPYASDLYALRMLSFNSIIDPWVFIIFQPSMLKFIWKKLRRRRPCGPARPPCPSPAVGPTPQITSAMLDI